MGTMTRMRAVPVVAVLAAAVVAAAPGPAATADAVTCRDITVPVTVGAAAGDIAATLCVPAGATRVQILIPGYTYNRSYWDFPGHDGEYSYARHAQQRGDATLALDRIGTGASWHPPAELLTHDAHVATVTQLVQAVRAGTVAPGLTQVVLVGHSYGSRVAYGVASTPGLADAVISTSSRLNWSTNLSLLASPLVTWPATDDPKFAAAPPDPGYLTTRPGRRATFFNTANVAPGILEEDEAGKDLGGPAESPTSRVAMDTVAHQVNVPVLILAGTADLIACGPAGTDCPSAAAVSERDRAAFGPNADVRAALVTSGGHNLNLERTHGAAWAAMDEFLDTVPR